MAIQQPRTKNRAHLESVHPPNDTEGRTVAHGFKLYVKLMAALTAVRNHSKLNEKTLAERGAFRTFIEEGRLAAIVYYSWSGVVSPKADLNASKKEDQGAIVRCGALTDAGRAAL